MKLFSPLLTENIENGVLVCPKCLSQMQLDLGSIFCKKSGCEYATIEIPVIQNKIPILVNFDTTILDKEKLLATDGESLIPRTGNKYDALKRFFWGSGKNTQKNLTKFLTIIPKYESKKTTVLIIGGGAIGNGMSALYEEKDVNILSFDIYASANIDFIADGHSLPIANESIDAIWIQAVLEHVMYPQKVVSEIFRVLNYNGIVYAETPFMQHVHEGPYDFTRFTESGHRLLFKNFKLVDSGSLTGIGTVLLWNIRYATWGLTRSKKFAIAITLLFGWVRHFDNLVPDSFNVDTASGVYFLGKKDLNHTFTDKDIITHYKGYQRK